MAGAPIKILQVVFSLEPGGMENGLINVARALDPAEFEVQVCCLERPGAFAGRLPEPRRIHVLGKKPGFSPLTAWRLARLIAKLNPQIIHSHNLGPLIYSGLATMLGRARPILQGEHAELTAEECQPRRLRQRQQLYRRCRKVHAVSTALHQQLISLGLPANKIMVLLNGVDTTRFAPGDPAVARQVAAKLPKAAVVLGIVGRFGPYKRHKVLIDAFSAVAARFPQVHLLVVGGGGPEQERVTAQIKTSPAADQIHLIGFQQDTVVFYQAMDLLVVPSVNEGMSNAVLEAMACGVPVLSNTACGNAEVIHHGEDGFVADLGTPEKLASHLVEILAAPGRLAEMGRKARENVAQRFSIARMVANYESLYRELAGPK